MDWLNHLDPVEFVKQLGLLIASITALLALLRVNKKSDDAKADSKQATATATEAKDVAVDAKAVAVGAVQVSQDAHAVAGVAQDSAEEATRAVRQELADCLKRIDQIEANTLVGNANTATGASNTATGISNAARITTLEDQAKPGLADQERKT